MNSKSIPGNNKDKKGGFSPFAYLLTSLLFLVIAIGLFIWSGTLELEKSPFGGLSIYLILLIVSMAFSAFIFGVMNSYATYSGKQLSGQLKLGGPIVGAALVMVGGYFFLKNTPSLTDPPNDKDMTVTISIRFSMDYANNQVMESWSKDRVTYIQKEPMFSRYDMIPQVSHPNYGEYVRDKVELPAIGETYKAIILRKTEEAFRTEDPTTTPRSTICFRMNSNANDGQEVSFSCSEGSQGIPELEYDWLEPCAYLSKKASFSLISETYALVQSLSSGWVVPSLSTLENKNTIKGTSYTLFKISSSQLKSLKGAQYFTYQIFVNDVPIYIDGMTREDTRTYFKNENGLKLSFGLENLDFSGAQLGKEIIRVELDIYSDKKHLKAVKLRRSYVALRNVIPVTIIENGIRFEWTGAYVIGKREDGYQLFIWSSENSGEIASNKQSFDSAKVKFENSLAVSVILL